MSSTLPSDEVAEDYKSSLEDLVVNDRNQIGVLTVIAKENTEHAMAISRVLENHIRAVRCSYHRHNSKLSLTDIAACLGTPSSQATSLIRTGLDRQKCWYTIYSLHPTKPLPNFHGGIYTCRLEHSEETG